MGDENDDYELSESVDRFRGAGANISKAIEHLYFGIKKEVKNLHPSFQAGIAVVMWFGGNWVYNRIKTPVLTVLTDVAENIPAKFLISPTFGLAETVSVSVWIQLFGMLLGVIVAQNRIHTQKLKRIEEELVTMNDSPQTATDGGTRKAQTPSGAGVGGAIAGGFAGASFGPGGVLAGAFVGYLLSEGILNDKTDDKHLDSLLQDDNRE